MTKKEKRQVGRTPAKLGTFAGHRTGKRKRGVSVLKQQPRANAVAVTFIVKDSDGIAVGRVKTFKDSQ